MGALLETKIYDPYICHDQCALLDLNTHKLTDF